MEGWDLLELWFIFTFEDEIKLKMFWLRYLKIDQKSANLFLQIRLKVDLVWLKVIGGHSIANNELF